MDAQAVGQRIKAAREAKGQHRKDWQRWSISAPLM